VHRILIVSIFTVLYGPTSVVHAEENQLLELLYILKDKGTITDKEYKQLKTLSSQPVSNGTAGRDVMVSTGGGIEVQSNDGAFSAEIGGRLMIDYAHYHEDKVPLGSGTELRRARLDLEGTMYADWGYELSVDFSDTSQEVEVKDAYIAYNSLSDYSVLIGHFKEPFSLEELTSSKYITFMERALPNVLAPGRNIGIGYATHWDKSSFAAGVFGEAVDDGDKSEDDEGWALTARGTHAPWASKRKALHLGLAASRREPDDSGEVKFSERPESHVTDIKYVNTGKITDVDYYISLGAELAWVAGPLSLQGEYMQTTVSRKTASDDPVLSGWYVFASYFLTGESRRYKPESGKFSKIKPSNKTGAWEVALRHSQLDLNDVDITGGEEHITTLGLNWYINSNIRAMLNYSQVKNDLNADDDGDVSGNDNPQVVQARMQLHF